MPKRFSVALATVAAAGAVAAVPALGSSAAAAASQPPAEGTRQPTAWGDGGEWTLPMGLTTDGTELVEFATFLPSLPVPIGTISGLEDDFALVGIDYRPSDGELYGVGDAGGIYTLDTDTAEATLVSRLEVGLVGTYFGVDFNPVADLLRVVSDSGQNLAHNIELGTTTENNDLTYPPSLDPAVGITGIAYTNNDLDDTTGTTLFDIDTDLDQLAIQSPPAAGLLVPTGQLGVDADPSAGFDIKSTLVDGVAVHNAGFAALSVDGSYGFYSVDLLSGQVELIGEFPDDTQVFDVALPVED